MQAPSFPTTQEIDIHSTPIVELITRPMKAVHYSRSKALELFKALREAAPSLSISEFKSAYSVSDSVCAWIETNMETVQ